MQSYTLAYECILRYQITILYQLGKELLTHILSSTILWPPYWKMAAIEVRGHWFSYIRTFKLKPAGLTTKVTLNSWLDDEIWILIYFLSAILENGRNWGQRSNLRWPYCLKYFTWDVLATCQISCFFHSVNDFAKYCARQPDYISYI